MATITPSENHHEDRGDANHDIPSKKSAKERIAELEAEHTRIRHRYMDDLDVTLEKVKKKQIDSTTYSRSLRELERVNRAQVARIEDQIRNLGGII